MPKKAGGKKAAAKKKQKKEEQEDEDVDVDVGEEVEELEVKGKKRKEVDDEDEDKPAKKAKATKGKGKGKGKAKADDEEEKEGPPTVVVDAAYFATPKKEEGHLKIVSWNVAGFQAVLAKKFLEYLKNEDPDIICLQETKEKVALKSGLPTNYHAYFNTASKPGYSGVGLMSKIKPIAVTKGIGINEHDSEGRVLTAEYETFYLVTTYVPNSGQKLDKLEYRVKSWDVALLAYLQKLETKKPVVWCGDLNVAHLEIDLKNPKTNKKTAGFTKEERESFTKILNAGFVDSFRHFYPTQEGAYTFWTYKMNSRAKDTGWRLDYFIVSKAFMPSVVDHVIRKHIHGSDHCPILLLLKN